MVTTVRSPHQYETEKLASVQRDSTYLTMMLVPFRPQVHILRMILLYEKIKYSHLKNEIVSVYKFLLVNHRIIEWFVLKEMSKI